MRAAGDPMTAQQRPSTAPLVVAVATSTVVTFGITLVALVAAATDCGFAGSRCDSGSSSSPVLVALVAVAVAWASTVWIATARHGSAPRWRLYLAGVGVPLASGALATAAIVASAS